MFFIMFIIYNMPVEKQHKNATISGSVKSFKQKTYHYSHSWLLGWWMVCQYKKALVCVEFWHVHTSMTCNNNIYSLLFHSVACCLFSYVLLLFFLSFSPVFSFSKCLPDLKCSWYLSFTLLWTFFIIRFKYLCFFSHFFRFCNMCPPPPPPSILLSFSLYQHFYQNNNAVGCLFLHIMLLFSLSTLHFHIFSVLLHCV